MSVEITWIDELGLYERRSNEGDQQPHQWSRSYHHNKEAPLSEWTFDPLDALRSQVASLRQELDENYVVLDRAGKEIISLRSELERKDADLKAAYESSDHAQEAIYNQHVELNSLRKLVLDKSQCVELLSLISNWRVIHAPHLEWMQETEAKLRLISTTTDSEILIHTP